MKSKGQNEKITKIIQISQNYKSHRLTLQTIKPTINSLNKKRFSQIEKLSLDRLKNRKNARNFQNSLLQIQNNKFGNRLVNIANEDRRKKLSQHSTFRQIKDLQNGQSLSNSKVSKRLKSSSSARSFSSVSSNFRRRTLRQKQIQRQNIQIAKRIMNPKTVRTLAIAELKKSYSKQQQIMKTRSRYSAKNQQIIRNLALHGLKFDKKDVQYLPQLIHKRKNVSKQQYS